jgi:hypothetical protein
MPRGRRRYNSEPFEFDPNPIYAVKVNPDGSLDHSAAFDPQYSFRCDQCQKVFPLKDPDHDCNPSSGTETESRG